MHGGGSEEETPYTYTQTSDAHLEALKSAISVHNVKKKLEVTLVTFSFSNNITKQTVGWYGGIKMLSFSLYTLEIIWT